MGKNFEKEINSLDITYRKVLETDVSVLSNFLSTIRNEAILLVGSGGSFSVASAVEYLLLHAGYIAKAVTPVGLGMYSTQIRKMSIILFTAGGRNKDTINTYKFLSDLEPNYICSVCMKEDAPLKSIQRANLHNLYFEWDMPTKKDGYLAVNSLIASILLFSKALYELTKNNFFKLDLKYSFVKPNISSCKEVITKDSIIVLHGGITTPVAIDLESKFSETALGNVQLVDYRNFAHGRHFWIAHRVNKSSIIVMSSKKYENLIKRTLKLIPEEIPILNINMVQNNILGFLDCYMNMFHVVKEAGILQNIDPGNPKVSEFGRKMYHLSYNQCNDEEYKVIKRNCILAAVNRKICGESEQERFNQYYNNCNEYIKEISKKDFRGIIFDYDGTLHQKGDFLDVEKQIYSHINRLLEKRIIVGIATGRGKSVRVELQRVIKKEFWDSVLIGYYNCSTFGFLSDDYKPDKSITKSKNLLDISAYLKDFESHRIDIDSDNPYQISIKPKSKYHIDLDLLREICLRWKGIKLVYSSHSVDIILDEISKSNIIDELMKYSKLADSDILFIGDSGAFGGNDFEMLSSKYSLSVDTSSKSDCSCWNIAPIGLRNLDATKYYFEKIIIGNRGYFSIDLKNKR